MGEELHPISARMELVQTLPGPIHAVTEAAPWPVEDGKGHKKRMRQHDILDNRNRRNMMSSDSPPPRTAH